MAKSAVTIRPMRLGDVTTLHRLFLRALSTDFQYFPPAYIKEIARQNSTRHLLLSLLDSRRLILVAVRKRSIVGFAFASAHRDLRGHLYWLYVKPRLRREQVGKRLLSATLEGMRARGMSAVELVTYNYEGYYEHHGFYDRGEVNQHSLDLHVMQYDFPEAAPREDASASSSKAPTMSRRKAKIAAKHSHSRARHKAHGVRWPFVVALILLAAGLAALKFYAPNRLLSAEHFLAHTPAKAPAPAPTPAVPGAGTIVQLVSRTHYTPEQVTTFARQNYGPTFAASARGVTRLVIRYRTEDLNNQLITDYAQVYIPDAVSGAPILAMAPGTTGLTASCAVSVEDPLVRNWANYNSHMLAYASRGFTGVVTDYDNMRGANPPQPYMIGELEGRAVLDSIRALKHLPEASTVSNFNQVFAAGYSQGGHAAFWADSINKQYAPDVKLAGVIGWGAVLNVQTAWQGITAGSTLEWFGPAVLESYSTYYRHTYNLSSILLPQWVVGYPENVLGHCIDSDLTFWSTNPAKVYTPQFLSDLKSGVLPVSRYGDLQQDLSKNQVIDNSSVPKLVNQGAKDNVVIPAQQPAAVSWLCHGGAAVDLDMYPTATHYDLMVQSFNNVLDWIDKVAHHEPVPSTCSS